MHRNWKDYCFAPPCWAQPKLEVPLLCVQQVSWQTFSVTLCPHIIVPVFSKICGPKQSCQCYTTELQQLDNHWYSQSSISHIHQPLSICHQRFVEGCSGGFKRGSMEPLFWRAAFENTMHKRTYTTLTLELRKVRYPKFPWGGGMRACPQSL